MSQRDSGYERKERDLYETPGWVTHALLPHLPPLDLIWEPACGSGKMACVLERHAGVKATDIEPNYDGAEVFDFLCFNDGKVPAPGRVAIITNPPYELAQEFCEHALQSMEASCGVAAMLLRCDFDHAKSRIHLFRDCPAFAKKLILMRRICWFVEADGKPKASPSFNHAWYIWDWKHDGPPTIAYGS